MATQPLILHVLHVLDQAKYMFCFKSSCTSKLKTCFTENNQTNNFVILWIFYIFAHVHIQFRKIMEFKQNICFM